MRGRTLLDLKTQARHIFHKALRQVDVATAVARNLRVEDNRLLAAGAAFDFATFSDIQIVAIGKAATPMYEAAARVLRSAAWPAERLSAIVVSPHQPLASHGALTFFPGSHPTPDETSRQAATAILHHLRQATASTLVLFLMSGGSSAMVESPLDPAISTSDLAAFYRILVGCGFSIANINTLRKYLSAVKGGRLAEAAAPAAQCTLIVSDVPGPLNAVGSGPSLPDSSSREQCLELYQRLRAIHPLPPTIASFFEAETLPETPRQTHPAFARAAWTGILSSNDLATAAATAAQAAGFHTEIDNTCDEWPSDDAAAHLLDRSVSLAHDHQRTCLISVGEVVVTLSTPSGRGGRNQHFALQCALRLASTTSQTTVLSAGTDGIDGNSPAAGAIADQDTCRRAFLQGIDPSDTLTHFDSFRLFRALGDTILTGPTGNNLRDLKLLLT